MKIIDRYILKNLLVYSFFVLLILTLLFSVFSFLEETEKIGTGEFELFDALVYAFLRLIPNAYNVLVLSFLIGITIAIGNMSNNKELIILKNANISYFLISKKVVFFSFLTAFIFSIPLDYFSFSISEYANQYRANKLNLFYSDKLTQDIWFKNGNRIINIESLNGTELREISIFDVNNSSIKKIINSESGTINNNEIHINNAKVQDLKKKYPKNNLMNLEKLNKKISIEFNKEILHILEKKPENLSLAQLISFLYYSENQGMNKNYLSELYGRLLRPFLLVSMVILSLPQILNHDRVNSLSSRIFFGVIIGISAYFIIKFSVSLGVALDINPLLSNLFPVLLILSIGILLFNKRLASNE